MSSLRRTLLVISAVLLASLATAIVVCDGVLDSPKLITTTVEVKGGSCQLKNVEITGDVVVMDGGSLTCVGSVTVQGCIHAFKNGKISLWSGLKVFGGLSVMDSSGPVFVGKNTMVGAVSLVHVDKFTTHGTMNSISSTNAGSISLVGATILGGGIFKSGGNGNVKVCGSNVEGGVTLTGTSSNLLIEKTANCAESIIDGALSMNKGTGNLIVDGADLTATDIIAEEQKGNVVVKNAKVSDVAVKLLDGSVTLQSVEADSDAGFSDVSGSVSLLAATMSDAAFTGVAGKVMVVGSKFSDASFRGVKGPLTVQSSTADGDLNIGGNNAVTLSANNFGLEVVTVEGNAGKVTVTNNKEFTIALTENKAGILFSGNDLRFASISKNFGTIQIFKNKLQLLSCIDNQKTPVGVGNIILLESPGQCAGLRKPGSEAAFDPSLFS